MHVLIFALTDWLLYSEPSRQANTYEELPEQVIGAARLAHVEPATAVVPDLSNTSNDSSSSSNDNNSNNNGSSEDDVSKKTN
jgi:hypothetical protein